MSLDAVINYTRLAEEAPEWRNLELNYRSGDRFLRKKEEYTVHGLFCFLLLGVVIAVAISMFNSVFITLDAFPLFLSLGFFFAIFIYTVSRQFKTALTLFLLFTLTPIAIFLLYWGSQYLLSRIPFAIFCGLLTAYVCDEVFKHYMNWIAANPLISYDAHIQRKKWISHRFDLSSLGSLRRDLEKQINDSRKAETTDKTAILEKRLRELQAFSKYKQHTIVMVLLFGGLAMIPSTPYVPEWLKTAPVYILPPLIISLLLFKSNRIHQTSLRQGLSFTWKAVMHWFLTGTDEIEAPGVHTSPSGPRTRRMSLFYILFITLAAIMLPSLDYLPIMPTEYPLFEYVDGQLQKGNVEYLILFPLTFFIFLIFPLVLFLSVLLPSSSAILEATFLACEAQDAYEKEPTLTRWEAFTQRLQNSVSPQYGPKERDHFLLGAHIISDIPILLHKDILSEHAHFTGDSGSGKTALGIAPLLTQIIRRAENAVVILDLKGDPALFHGVAEESVNAGLDFKHFTNELNKSSFLFNPFRQTHPGTLSISQLCETILEALNLNHGEGYGRSFFSRVSRRWLTLMLRERPNINSFKELYELTKDGTYFSNPREQRDAFELICVIESLASVEPLDVTARAQHKAWEHSIYMPDVIEKKQVIYFWLPSSVETATVRETAKLALYSLLSAAYSNVRKNGSSPQTFLFIDEFQRIASDNFKIVLQQARAMGIGAILANQTSLDLKTPDADLRPTLQSNTRLKLQFSATALDQQEQIMKSSGQTSDWLSTYSVSRAEIVEKREILVPRINQNHIIEITDHPFFAVCQISRGSGYSQYSGYSFPMRTWFHIDKAKYQELTAKPWPEKDERTIVNTRGFIPEDVFGSVDQRLEVEEQIIAEEARDSGSAKDTRAEWIRILDRMNERYHPPLENEE